MKTLILILLSLILISCSSTKESTKSTDESPSYNSYSKSAGLSDMTKSFINQIKNERKNLNKMQKYIPSQNLINEYNIFLNNGTYYIGSKFKINNEMDSAVLDAIGVIIVSKIENNWTANIPVDMLEDVVNYSGIDYLQIDENDK